MFQNLDEEKELPRLTDYVIMSSTPALIVLYDTDAVEVRYSDGSRLELSPCGATMIYQPARGKDDHPRQDFSNKVHKRTCFVTSDHKDLVIRALDFRNRFANRPYLCEELIQTENIVTLYALVNSVQWPESTDSGNVEILDDGSRRITSLDDFASLIVSPHGQDFSISYLSRISRNEDKRTETNPQFLYSNSTSSSSVPPLLSSHQGSLHTLPTAKTTNNDVVPRPLASDRVNEAVVQPFQIFSIEDNVDSSPNGVINVENTTLSNRLDIGSKDKKLPEAEMFEVEELGVVKETSDSSSELDTTLVEDIPTPNLRDCGANISDCGGYSNMKFATDLDVDVITNSSTKEVCSNQHGSNSNHNESISHGSSVAHDISSISRSSTPDGLRTTIDSDATLIHDLETNPSAVCAPITYKYHRHSSPTHSSSSPFEAHLPFVNSEQTTKRNLNSLDGSYLDEQRGSLLQFYDKCDADSDSVNRIKPHDPEIVEENSLLMPYNTAPHILGKMTMSPNSEKTTENQNEKPITTNHLPVPSNKTSQPVMKFISNSNCNMQLCSEGESQTRHFREDGKNLYERDIQNLNSGFQPQGKSAFANPPMSEGGSVKLLEYETTGSMLSNVDVGDSRWKLSINNQNHLSQSPRLLSSSSSVINVEKEQETACRKKYVWVTAHASRHSCPKEWTHPLMLALKVESRAKKSSSSSSSSPSASTGQKMSTAKPSPIPKPLPLSCPFQHKHRMSQQHYQATESSHTHSSTKEDSLISKIGEFQQGRLKVVMTDGVIFRLISSDEMTVVEIYPGDGTVLVSQGVKAIFFTHFIPRVDVLEERTYSLKSLPPGCAKGRHSIEKMMKTANRLVNICVSWDKRNGHGKAPCWQKEMVAVVEPLSSSLLEECCVGGLGRFSAFTNGRVRILFDDRTSLDTVADFSSRVRRSAEPQGNTFPSVTTGRNSSTTARLLVPSGNYLTVEFANPGHYAKYLSAAKEWIAWVNASLTERQEFYKQHYQPRVLQQAAELELKKIFCFNYIVEHSALLPTTYYSQSKSVSIDNQHNSNKNDTCNGTTSPSNVVACNKVINFPQPTIYQPSHLAQGTQFGSSSSSSSNHQHHHHLHHHRDQHQPVLTTSMPATTQYGPYIPHSTISTAAVPSMSSQYPGISHHASGHSHHPPNSSHHASGHSHHHQPVQDTAPSLNHINRHHNHHQYQTPSHSATPYPSNFMSSTARSRSSLLSLTSSDDKCINTTLGFQSVRSALALTSNLINDIEMFLEENKS